MSLNDSVQNVFSDFIKLNYRCPKGKFVQDSFACGKTPEEAKKNYQEYQKEKKGIISGKEVAAQEKKTTKKAVEKAKNAKKLVKKVLDPTLQPHVDNVKNLIAKVNEEKKTGKVSKETFKALKTALSDLKGAKKPIVEKVVNKGSVESVQQEPSTVSKVVNSDLAVDKMQPGEVWNGGLVGDIRVDEVDGDSITVTANGFTETMTKGALKKALKEYNVTKKDGSKLSANTNRMSSSEKKGGVNQGSSKEVGQSERLSDLKNRIIQLSDSIKSSEENGDLSSWGDSLELDSLKGDYWIESMKGKIGSKADFSEKDVSSAIKNTSNAKVTKDGLQLTMARYQRPEIAGKTALRDGVFYLPTAEGEDHKLYTDPKTAYGGSQKITVTTTFKNPLMVNASTGGSMSERAYRAIVGEDKFNELDKRLWDCQGMFTGFKGKQSKEVVIDAISDTLKKYGGNPDYAKQMYDTGWGKRADGGADPVLYFTMREHIFGHAVKDAGYDSIIGYDGKDENSQALTEVFDLRSNKNPVPNKELDSIGVTNTESLSKDEKIIFDNFIKRNADSPTFKNGKNGKHGHDIHDMSDGVTASRLLMTSMWNDKEFEVVKKVALASATSDIAKTRVNTALWAISNTLSGNGGKIGVWSQEDSKIIDYQKGKKVDKKYAKMANDLESMIRSGPKYNAEVFRGIGNLDDNTYKDILNAKEFKWNTLSATSTNEEVASMYATGTWGVDQGFNDNNIIFNIKKSKSGVYISDYGSFAGLDEVLVPKDTSYKVMGIKEKIYIDGSGKKRPIKIMELEEV